MIRNGLFKVVRRVKGPISVTQNIRCLYTKEALGLDGYVPQRERIQNQMGNMALKFKEKMNDYALGEGKNMIFSEDLKIMLHLAENENDVDVAVNMMKKFNQQNKELRFGAYIFGPVVMRMFYHLNEPIKALECFKAPELNGFFDQLTTYQILMDLLYENKLYDEVLEVFEIITEKQLEGARYPKNPVVLALAACYKMNTKESYEYAITLWRKLMSVGHNPMRRATTFCAALALRQGEPAVALEVLTSAKNQNYTTVRNLKILALAKVGRVEQALPILKSVLGEDTPGEQRQTFNKECIDELKEVVTKSDNPELIVEFNRIEQLLQKQGLLHDMSLEDQLCQEIQKRFDNRQNNFQGPFGRQEGYGRPGMERPRRSFPVRQSRPGLKDLQ